MASRAVAGGKSNNNSSSAAAGGGGGEGLVELRLKYRGSVTSTVLSRTELSAQCSIAKLAGNFNIPAERAKFMCRGKRLRSDEDLMNAVLGCGLIILIGTPKGEEVRGPVASGGGVLHASSAQPFKRSIWAWLCVFVQNTYLFFLSLFGPTLCPRRWKRREEEQHPQPSPLPVLDQGHEENLGTSHAGHRDDHDREHQD